MSPNLRMTVRQLMNLLRRYPDSAFVELRIVVPGVGTTTGGIETYVTEPAGVIPSRDSKGRLIVQVTNES